MLSRISEHIHAKIESTEYFEKYFPMVELVAEGDKVYPAYYIGKGQYKPVSNFDHYNGMAYLRMTGKERFIDVTDGDQFGMCDTLMQIDFPLRLVVCVPKKKLDKDDAYSDDRLSRTIAAVITQRGGDIKQALRASAFRSFVESINMDSRSVLSEEYQNLPKLQDINYNFSYCAIDFVVTIKIKASCLATECQEAYYG